MFIFLVLCCLVCYEVCSSHGPSESADLKPDKAIDDVLAVCRLSGCIVEDHAKQHDTFVQCMTTSIPQSNNCRDGYSPYLDTSDFDFIYDFNSLYAYDNAVYESLAWAAPERTQFVKHALFHKPSRVAINIPINQLKWSYGVIWALKQLCIEVTELPYDNEEEKALLDHRWRNSSKWIGLRPTCNSVCRPCLRAMTLASYLHVNTSSYHTYKGPLLACNEQILYPHARHTGMTLS